MQKKYFVLTFLISLSVLVFELALIRIFSVVMLSNIAFLAISIALFGLAFGGIIVYAFPKYFCKEKLQNNLGLFSLLYGLSLILFLFVFLQFDFSVFKGWIYILFFLLSATPFIVANICLSALFKIKSGWINKLYFFDLMGAGIGVVLAIILMNLLSGINVILVAALLGLVASAVVNYEKKKLLFFSFIIILLLVPFIVINQQINFIKLVYSKIGKENNIIFEKWNSFSRITVKEQTEGLESDSLPTNQNIVVPQVLGIRIDASAFTSVLNFNSNFNSVDYLKKCLTALSYSVVKNGKTLIIGPGGGRDVLTASIFGFEVKGVDINPIIINDLMKNKLKDFSGGLYTDYPKIDIEVAEGRSFINKDQEKYEVVNLPLVDTWSSTAAGNLFLVENHLYTVEAFESYMKHLKPNGILTISRWELDGMRLVSQFLEASNRLGISSPEKNIVVVSNGKKDEAELNNYLFKTTVFSKNELQIVEEFVQQNGFNVIYSPNKNNDNDYYKYLLSSEKKDFIDNYNRNLKPVYDNDPFFFFVTPIERILSLKQSEYSVMDGGLVLVFLVVLLFSLLCIFFPMCIFSNYKNKKDKTSWLYLSYFGCLGLAFMMLEIVLIQKFILYLEQPIYSYSVVLASLLIFAGMGSFLSDKINSLKNVNYLKIGLGIFLFVLLEILSLKYFIDLTISWSIFSKIFLVALINAPLAILMGMLLPLGIRRLNLEKRDFLIPWCWAVNGATSVLASALAVLFAIIFGFNIVLLVAAILYLISCVFILIESKVKLRL